MRVGKRTREHAALICQAAESNRDIFSFIDIARALGLRPSSPAVHVAAYVYARCYLAVRPTYQTLCAESESMLRSGWNPGDPVRRLR